MAIKRYHCVEQANHNRWLEQREFVASWLSAMHANMSLLECPLATLTLGFLHALSFCCIPADIKEQRWSQQAFKRPHTLCNAFRWWRQGLCNLRLMLISFSPNWLQLKPKQTVSLQFLPLLQFSFDTRSQLCCNNVAVMFAAIASAVLQF